MPAWHSLALEEVFARLRSGPDGLAPREAAERLARIGPNTLIEPPRPGFWSHVARQFASVLVALLAAAALASGLLGEWVDCAVIGAILVLNAWIGAAQEHSAARSLEALRKLGAPLAKVRRAGRVLVVPAAEIVPGDVLVLEAGDLLAADARIFSATSLASAESALTGESQPVEKRADGRAAASAPPADRFNMVHGGTAVATGRGEAIVVATGMESEVGRIAGLVLAASRTEDTPLRVRLRQVGRLLAVAALAIAAAMFAAGLARGEPALELALAAVSLAVAAVPEGLAAIVTVAMALGVRRMVRRRVLMRRLPAVETLGCTSVICTDKTGTLTVGQMTVRALWAGGAAFEVSGEGYAPYGSVRPVPAGPAPPAAATLSSLALNFTGCNNASLVRREDGAWDAAGDPTEAALLAAASKCGAGGREATEAAHPRLAEIPFDSDRKRACVIRAWNRPAGARAFVNGAPESVLARCSRLESADGVERPLSDVDRGEILALNAAWAGRGLRVLAFARRDLPAPVPGPDGRAPDAEEIERALTLVGLAGLADPPRPEARAALRRCESAGIRVVMITGDQPRTALAVARELGLAVADDGRGVLAGPDLARMGEDELRERVADVAVFARVTPADKLRIVRAWQARGAVVAMTGDGVNDAPALRGADVGVAMGRTGTEVAKQAADVIVMDDDFASIVAAVEEGRGVYDNVRKTMQYLLGGNAAELLLIAACFAAGLPSPLLAVQILWINLVTDGLPALMLAADPVAPDVMLRQPRPRVARLMDRPFLLHMALTALLTAGVAFAAYLHGLDRYDERTARTHAFAVLVFAELLRSFGCRSGTLPAWRSGVRSNLPLLAVVLLTFALQIASHHIAPFANLMKTATLDWTACATLVLLGCVPFAILEAAKPILTGHRAAAAKAGAR